jgi:DNA-binding transcriptional regulator YiaG
MATRVNVRAIRDQLDLSREDFGRLFPVSSRTVRRWENGEVEGMSPMAEKRLSELTDHSETKRKTITVE